jgi:hypothetical protein
MCGRLIACIGTGPAAALRYWELGDPVLVKQGGGGRASAPSDARLLPFELEVADKLYLLVIELLVQKPLTGKTFVPHNQARA